MQLHFANQLLCKHWQKYSVKYVETCAAAVAGLLLVLRGLQKYHQIFEHGPQPLHSEYCHLIVLEYYVIPV